VFEFGVKEWGPQALQVMLASTSCNGLSLGVAKDAGVKEVKDLRGKRVGFVVGSPALNQGTLAIMAFGGLTRADVKPVEFSSYGAMWKGLVNNEADAAFASTISGQAREVDASPRGLMWPSTPADDKAGWARLQKIGPYFYPHKAECGAAVSKEAPIVMPAYPYPIFMAYASQPADLIHSITKAMIVNYADYKDGAPGADGLELKRQNLAWVLPYHEGAVRALKEAGVWTAAAQAHNDALLKRQNVLLTAWADFTKASPPEDKDAFYKAWMAKRKAALTGAGLDPIFE
jgi:TRAP transporter TAXI family solute receptor